MGLPVPIGRFREVENGKATKRGARRDDSEPCRDIISQSSGSRLGLLS
jgi:hypothetical protein